MNNLIYEPNLTDREYWEHRMFRIVNPPPKLDNWQDYFVRYKQGDEDFFAVFLHYYEPELNKIVKRFGSRYGLIDHFADLKMAYIEAMLTLLQDYDPDCGVDFILSVRRKLRDALHAYTMTNLKGFSETSPERYRQLRKAAYLYKNSAPGEEVSAIGNALDVKPKNSTEAHSRNRGTGYLPMERRHMGNGKRHDGSSTGCGYPWLYSPSITGASVPS